tara:strand:- start:247 stop:777 length:531 start_codon:yes stop_codon:yes gene_type:complete
MENKNQKTNYRPLLTEIMNKLYKNGFLKAFALLLSLSISIYSAIEVFKSLDNYQIEIDQIASAQAHTSAWENATKYNCKLSWPDYDVYGGYYANGQNWGIWNTDKFYSFIEKYPDAIVEHTRETVKEYNLRKNKELREMQLLDCKRKNDIQKLHIILHAFIFGISFLSFSIISSKK